MRGAAAVAGFGRITPATAAACSSSSAQRRAKYRFVVTVLLQLDVFPTMRRLPSSMPPGGPVAWEPGQKQCLRRGVADSPGDAASAGFAMATRPDWGPDGACTVRVEVWSDDEPAGLRCIHQGVMHVGSQGVVVGNDQSGGVTELALAAGERRLRIFADAEASRDVLRVVFALSEPDAIDAEDPRPAAADRYHLLGHRRASPVGDVRKSVVGYICLFSLSVSTFRHLSGAPARYIVICLHGLKDLFNYTIASSLTAQICPSSGRQFGIIRYRLLESLTGFLKKPGIC